MKKCRRSKTRRQQRRKRSSEKKRQGPVEKIVAFREEIREALLSDIRQSVAATARQLVEDEVVELVGAPWSRKGGSPLRRGGSTETRIFLDGEPVMLARTRVRDQVKKQEYSLRSVQALGSRDALDEDVKRLLVRGVSTRNYDEALTTLSDGLGLKRTAVSSAFKRASQKQLDALNGRDLGEWTFVAVFIDGIQFGEHICIVALGVTKGGEKRILGVREGATENSEVVTDLLTSLLERGLKLTSKALFVLDGGKALGSAVRDVFGATAVIQRCIQHKQRNVVSYLPDKWHSEARRRLRAAWGMTSYKEAREALLKVVTWLEKINESAAKSLEEGFEETLTVHRLQITGSLRRTMITTNPIESAFDIVKQHASRVKCWNGARMVLRWAASGLLRAEGQFRRVNGYSAIPRMVTALENFALNEAKDVA